MINSKQDIGQEEEYETRKPWWRWLLMAGVFTIIGLGVYLHIWLNY